MQRTAEERRAMMIEATRQQTCEGCGKWHHPDEAIWTEDGAPWCPRCGTGLAPLDSVPVGQAAQRVAARLKAAGYDVPVDLIHDALTP